MVRSSGSSSMALTTMDAPVASVSPSSTGPRRSSPAAASALAGRTTTFVPATASAAERCGCRSRSRNNGGDEQKKLKKGSTYSLDNGMEALQEWRLGMKIWRDVKNADPFRVQLLARPLNFKVDGHLKTPIKVALTR